MRQKSIENWRTIPLPNIDYDIISKTITSSLKLVLAQIISLEQTRIDFGRDIAEN